MNGKDGVNCALSFATFARLVVPMPHPTQ
jgi:hypothetical protein